MTHIQGPMVDQMAFAHPSLDECVGTSLAYTAVSNAAKRLAVLVLLLAAAPVTAAWWALLLWLAWP